MPARTTSDQRLWQYRRATVGCAGIGRGRYVLATAAQEAWNQAGFLGGMGQCSSIVLYLADENALGATGVERGRAARPGEHGVCREPVAAATTAAAVPGGALADVPDTGDGNNDRIARERRDGSDPADVDTAGSPGVSKRDRSDRGLRASRLVAYVAVIVAIVDAAPAAPAVLSWASQGMAKTLGGGENFQLPQQTKRRGRARHCGVWGRARVAHVVVLRGRGRGEQQQQHRPHSEHGPEEGSKNEGSEG